MSTPHGLLDPPPPDHVVEISAFILETRLNRKNVAKALTKTMKAELKDLLSGLPSWIVYRTQNFSRSLLPFPKPPSRTSTEGPSSQPASDQNSGLLCIRG